MRFVAAIVCLLALTGCVRYQSQPILPPQTAASLDARSMTSPALKSFLEKNRGRTFAEWPPKAWDFETLTLVAIYFHPDLEVARAQWRVSEAEVITAGGRPNPTLAVTPGYNFNAASGVSPWLPAMTIDWPVEVAGKRDHRIVRAQHLAESARLNIASAVWRVRSNLRAALIELGDAHKRFVLLSKQQAAQQQLVGSLEQRAEAGAITAVEVAPARIAFKKIHTDMLDAQRRTTEALVQVASALGIPMSGLEKDFRFDGVYAMPLALPPNEARRAALTSRADIAAALADYEAAQSALQLEIAKQYPDIHIGTGYQWDQGESKWQLGLTAEIPVLNRNQGPIAAAQARREEAAARFVAAQAKAMGEIDRALAGFRASTARGKALGELAASLRQQHDAIAAQVKAGATDRLDLLASDVELAAAELQQWDGELKTTQAAAALEDAIQHPLNPAWQSGIERGPQTAKEQP
ncbi:MAG: TolC family protein [Verrucomicrobia bacterium]|nr:TolC family protein [Verrucomicrobiota bacterium]